MKKVDYLIIGGSAAGTTAADTIRNLLPEATITIVTDEKHEQYSRVLIPHYIRGKVVRDQVFLKKPEWYVEKNIELLGGIKVVGIDVGQKLIKLSGGKEILFGKLLITVGGYVIPLNIPGIDGENIVYMRTVEDADQIIAKAKSAKRAVIIGGGFIGLEFASCLRVNGVNDVTMLVRESSFWSGKLDQVSGKIIADTLGKNGVKIVTNIFVDHFENGAVVANNGQKFPADLFGIGIGIKSDLAWLEGTEIKINRAISTNEFLETSAPGIFAAGDCAEFHDVIFERQHIVGNWSNATSQGAAVGKTMAGQKTVFETASSYSISFFEPPNGGSCSFLGVTEADYANEVIARGSMEENKMTRIFIKRMNEINRIVGATIINGAMDVAPLTMVIKNRTDVSAHMAELDKAEFDLKQLIST